MQTGFRSLYRSGASCHFSLRYVGVLVNFCPQVFSSKLGRNVIGIHCGQSALCCGFFCLFVPGPLRPCITYGLLSKLPNYTVFFLNTIICYCVILLVLHAFSSSHGIAIKMQQDHICVLKWLVRYRTVFSCQSCFCFRLELPTAHLYSALSSIYMSDRHCCTLL